MPPRRTVVLMRAAPLTLRGRVLARRSYEVTSALPIEYGVLNAAAVVAGVIFYAEHRYMAAWQVACSFLGVVVVLAGVALSAMTSAPRCGAKLSSKVSPDTSQDVDRGEPPPGPSTPSTPTVNSASSTPGVTPPLPRGSRGDEEQSPQ